MKKYNQGRNHPQYGKPKSIETRKKISFANKGKHHSVKTEFKKGKNSGKNHPQWKGGFVEKKCILCNKKFEVAPAWIKRGRGKFCSRRCRSIWVKMNFKNKDTSIEIMMEKELIDNKIPYLKQVPIAGIALVDFLISNNIIIQCDGNYWHNLPNRKNKDIKQDFLLSFMGYKIFRFTEMEINHSVCKCVKKILIYLKEAYCDTKTEKNNK